MDEWHDADRLANMMHALEASLDVITSAAPDSGGAYVARNIVADVRRNAFRLARKVREAQDALDIVAGKVAA